MNGSWRTKHHPSDEPKPHVTKAWIEDWRELFCMTNLLPDFHQDIPEQFNCITRIIIFLILFLYLMYGWNMYVLILIGVIVLLILLYFACYKRMFSPVKESYHAPPLPSAMDMARVVGRTSLSNIKASPEVRPPSSSSQNMLLYNSCEKNVPLTIPGHLSNPTPIDVQQSGLWCPPCNPAGQLPISEMTTSLNQKLVGGANPKTRIMPVIPPPIWDPDTWSPNDFVVPFKINDQRRQELHQNGYVTWDKDIPLQKKAKNLDQYSCRPSTGRQTQQQHVRPMPPPPKRIPISQVEREDGANVMVEEYSAPQYDNSQYGQSVETRQQYVSNFMDTAPGYYPQNTEYNYPVNLAPDSCQYSPEMKEYNKNLFTIPLQPNVYTRSQVNQTDASMSNLGISFTQPHLPTGCQMDDRGNMMITEYDPTQYPSEYLLRGRDPFANDIRREEVYDPRLTGYGTSYRSYVDPQSGQPRFFYDDVDAHTQYNYLTRNKIDFTRFGPITGPYEPNDLGGMDVRDLANQTFHDDVMKQRTELQSRLMAKNSHREWQQRSAPIHTNSFGRGSCGPSSASSYAGPRGFG